jgi:hypothetical protein
VSKIADLQDVLNSGEHPRQALLSLTRRRPLVRAQHRPLRILDETADSDQDSDGSCGRLKQKVGPDGYLGAGVTVMTVKSSGPQQPFAMLLPVVTVAGAPLVWRNLLGGSEPFELALVVAQEEHHQVRSRP